MRVPLICYFYTKLCIFMSDMRPRILCPLFKVHKRSAPNPLHNQKCMCWFMWALWMSLFENPPGRRRLEYAACISSREVKPSPIKIKRYTGYNTKLPLIVRFLFWRSGAYGVFVHCHYSLVHSDSVVSYPLGYLGVKWICWKIIRIWQDQFQR